MPTMKSKTSTARKHVAQDSAGTRRRLTHPNALLALVRLAFREEGRRHGDLDPLELTDVLIPTRRHRLAQRAEEVHRPVVHRGRSEQDVLEGTDRARLDPRAAGKIGMESRHAPVVSAARRLRGAG